MATSRVIYEHGITAQVIGSDWHIINIGGGRTEKIEHPGIIAQRYNVRPVVVTQSEGEIDILLRTAVQDPFGIKIANWEERAHKTIPDLKLDKIFNTAYLLQAIEYHCKQLALLCLEACVQMRKTSDIPGSSFSNSDKVMFTGVGEVYFEFDALITAVRRTYDSCRYLLWHFFGAKGTVPRSFHLTLDNCPALPEKFKISLNESWLKYGEEITAYRDCIQHYVPIDYGRSSLIMKKLDNESWSTHALMPDNPSARSRSKFVYAGQRDALTYGWEAANEVLEVATSIIETFLWRSNQ